MIQVFEELGFVTIKDGVMTVNKEAPKREIAESQIYPKISNRPLKTKKWWRWVPCKKCIDFLKDNHEVFKENFKLDC